MNYLGTKSGSGVYQAIIAQMPPHDTYIETHLGAGAVMLRKPPAPRSIGIEIDPKTIASFPMPAGVEVIQGDCVDVLRGLDFAELGRVLLYVDPPYLTETRKSAKRYRYDYDRFDHVRLLNCLLLLPARIIISGYPSALYAEHLDGWRTFTFQAMTRGGPRTEQVWMNFAAGDVAHASYAGRNFTDRQRIKRKAARWAAMYRELSPGERLAVLAAILGEHDESNSGPAAPAGSGPGSSRGKSGPASIQEENA